jgi:hypothetical protein
MIWPDFCEADGRSLPGDHPVPVGVELPAQMRVVVDQMRAAVHRTRIAPGVRFFCHEGGRRVAEGVVTRVTGLHTTHEGSRHAEPAAEPPRRMGKMADRPAPGHGVRPAGGGTV